MAISTITAPRIRSMDCTRVALALVPTAVLPEGWTQRRYRFSGLTSIREDQSGRKTQRAVVLLQ
jgi:hypothetical protein